MKAKKTKAKKVWTKKTKTHQNKPISKAKTQKKAPETKVAPSKEKAFEYIQTNKELENACKELEQITKFAIDIECENGLHHYGTYICLIQISSKDKHYIIDTLPFETRAKLLPLIKLLENEKIQKVLHDFSFDLRILYTQYKCRPKNIFDTQMASLLLGKEKIGLASLLEQYCNIKAEKKYQRYDWTRRPLSMEMLAYAIGDTKNLLFIQRKLIAELKEKKRLTWCTQECKEIENKELEYHEQGFYDLKGIRQLTDKERAVLLNLWQLRNTLAQKYDKPLHYVLGTRDMMELSKKPPKGEKGWKFLKKASRYIKTNAKQFASAVTKAKGGEIMVPPKPRKRMTREQKNAYEKLEEKRNKIAEKLKIRGHLIACNDQLLEVIVTNKRDCLRPWQKKLLQ